VDDRFEKRLRAHRRHDLALGVAATCFQAVVPAAPLLVGGLMRSYQRVVR
jgi:hypothetical protein